MSAVSWKSINFNKCSSCMQFLTIIYSIYLGHKRPTKRSLGNELNMALLIQWHLQWFWQMIRLHGTFCSVGMWNALTIFKSAIYLCYGVALMKSQFVHFNNSIQCLLLILPIRASNYEMIFWCNSHAIRVPGAEKSHILIWFPFEKIVNQ